MSPGCGHAGWTRVQHRCLTTLMLEEVTHDDQAKILGLISIFPSKHNVHSKYCHQTTAALSTATQYYAALLHSQLLVERIGCLQQKKACPLRM